MIYSVIDKQGTVISSIDENEVVVVYVVELEGKLMGIFARMIDAVKYAQQYDTVSIREVELQ